MEHAVTWLHGVLLCLVQLCVCHVYLCVFLRVCKVCLCVYLYTLVQDEWWVFPVYIAQLNMPVIAVWAEHPAGSVLKTLCLFYMEQLRPDTRSLFPFNCSQFTMFFFMTAATDSFHFGSRDVLRGCAHTCVCRWCISIHWRRSLNSSFCSAQEPAES